MILVQLGLVIILGVYGSYIIHTWDRANLFNKICCVIALCACFMMGLDGYLKSKDLMRQEAKAQDN